MRHVEHPTARLVVAGPAVDAVADDPEAAGVLAETRSVWRHLPSADRARVQLASLPMTNLDENALIVNALQRQASVIVKKSLQEGFGLGITEGMWKARPVVATRVGGQADQIVDGETGILLDDPADLEGFGVAVERLLRDTERGAALGRRGRERVRERYLADRHFIGWTRILADTIASQHDLRRELGGARFSELRIDAAEIHARHGEQNPDDATPTTRDNHAVHIALPTEGAPARQQSRVRSEVTDRC